MIKKNKYSTWILVVLAMLFVGPLVAAWSLYTLRAPWLNATINYGQLVQPPLNFNQLDLKNSNNTDFDRKNLAGHWVMVYVTPLPCDKTCQTNLYNMRQVRTATGKERERIQRLVITFPINTSATFNKLLNKEYSGTAHANISSQTMLAFFDKNTLKNVTPENGALYLVDPLGNLMMAYANNTPPKSLLKDLNRLLKTSQIG